MSTLPTAVPPAPSGLVGRDPEFRQLLARWELATQGQGQALLLSGDAGIGKSRLTQALRAHVENSGGHVLALPCTQDHQLSALFPLVGLLRRELGLRPGQSPEQAWLRLGDWLDAQLGEALALFAWLLGVPPQGQATALQSLSAAHKRELHQLLVRWLIQQAQRQPLLLLIEDLHWADASTLAVLHQLVERLAAVPAPLLVVLTSRPGLAPDWAQGLDGPHGAHLALGRLQGEAVKALLLRLTGGKPLPDGLAQRIAAHTDGVPLHVEQTAKLLLESGALSEQAGSYAWTGEADTEGALGGNLAQSLTRRLQRLTPGLQLAQLGALVGREFSHALIEALWTDAADTLAQGLRQLLDAELLQTQALDGEPGYSFQHALVQEAAQADLPQAVRAALHARIAHTLLARDPTLAQREPEVLAHHCAGAGQPERAVPYWLAAAERALETSAHAEAVAQLHQALAQLQALPDDAQRQRTAATLHIRLGVCLAALRGYAGEAVGQAYAQASALASQAALADLRLPANYGLWRFHLMRAEYPKAQQLALTLQAQAEEAGSEAFAAMAARALASTHFYTGDLGGTIQASQRVLQAQAAPAQRVAAFHYDVVDAWVTAASYRAWAHWLRGDEAAALQDAEEAERAARALRHPFSLTLALSFAGWLHQFRADTGALVNCVNEALSISEAHGFEFWIGWNQALLGWVSSLADDAAQGALRIEAGTRRWTATGSQLGKSYFMGLQAQALVRAHRLPQALQVLDAALAFADERGERFWQPELLRLRAQALAFSGADAQQVHALHAHALALAQAQGAWALQRRCERSQAALPPLR